MMQGIVKHYKSGCTSLYIERNIQKNIQNTCKYNQLCPLPIKTKHLWIFWYIHVIIE